MRKILLFSLIISAFTFSSCGLIMMGIGSAIFSDPGNQNTNLYAEALPYQQTSTEYSDKYADQMEENSKVVSTWYHYTVEQVDSQYLVKTFQPDTKQMTMLYTYNHPLLLMKKGSCKEWWDNGKPRLIGQYDDNQKTGEWVYFDYSTGKKKSSGYFRKGVKEGKWMYFNPKTGEKIAEINYSNNEKNGPFTLYNDGKKVGKGVYFKNEPEKITWDSTHLTAEVDFGNIIELENNEMPYLKSCNEFETAKERKKCTEQELLSNMLSTIKYPRLARENGLEGTAIVSFIIDKDGSLGSVQVQRGLCKEIEEECRRVVEELSSEWIAGVRNGEKASVRYNVPIRFRLQKTPEINNNPRGNG